MKSSLLVALVTLLISCQPTVVQSEADCKATFVRYEQIGCRLPTVLITEGIEQVRQVAKTSSDYRGYFSVYGLDSTYWQANRQLTLHIRYPSQLIVCDALGIPHPAIEVVSAH